MTKRDKLQETHLLQLSVRSGDRRDAMRRGFPRRFGTACLLLGALVCTGIGASAAAQGGVDTAQLLNKAHALEVRGRMDMAKDAWKQVLLIDPNNTDALAGLARAAKSEGNQREAAEYLQKLSAVNPNDPNIGRVETMSSAQANANQLQAAGRLAQSGQSARAMEIQRQVYGNNPPPGEAALGYYETEAGIPQERAKAVAGLRSLVARFPQEPRYEIALGKVLTYNPRTRPEGRRLLEKYPYDASSVQGLRDSLKWDVQNPAAGASIRAYLSTHNDPELANDLAQASQGRHYGRGSSGAASSAQREANAATSARNAEERAAYAALNAHNYKLADDRFSTILSRNAQSCQALTGLGYVRMSQSNFAGAISFLEQAEQDGCKDPAIERSLHDSRFFYTTAVATTALNDNDLFTAQKQFELALQLRPGDSSALLGLGGTMLKAQQPEQAISIFETYVKHSPGDMRAWRGLIMAEYGATKYNEALATERRLPPPVKAALMKDPDYLRTLGSVYVAVGREGDAQRVFQQALNLPFPNGGRGLKIDTQMQYAALLATVGRREQAAGLYQQVLQADPANTNAWVGLIQVEHQLGHDTEAFQLLQSMPPQIFAAAMQEAGFQSSVAAIDEGVNRDDLAQDVLEKLLAKQAADGKKPFVPAEIQLAAIYVRRGNSAQAYKLYQSILATSPDRTDAWVGVLSSLHSTDHDQDALAQIQQIPPATRRNLESDPTYLQVVGSIYSGLGDNQQAGVFFNRVQQYYAGQHLAPPADVQIQQAWLLYNSGADRALYGQLMMLGGRQDLTNQQRLTVQTIWTSWAVRRATQNVAAGDSRRAIAILNATAKSFPGNPTVIKALASGYASAGMPKEAVAIFRTQNLNTASASDYRAAIGAALAASDQRDAELWLRFGLAQYPRDAQLLILAAKFEQSRGDANRAADFYRATLSALPPVDSGSQLASELSRPAPAQPAPLPSANGSQDLATLLAEPDSGRRRMQMEQAAQKPYLPSYNAPMTNVPVPMNGYAPATIDPGFGNSMPQPGFSPGYGTPASGLPPNPPTQPSLRDYTPHSRVAIPSLKNESVPEQAILHLHPSHEMEAKYGPYIPFDPSVGAPRFTNAPTELGDGVLVAASTSGKIVTAKMVQSAFQQAQPQQSSDGTPSVSYIPPSRPNVNTRAPRQSADVRAKAAAIRANQNGAANVPISGQSHPPVEDYSSSQVAAPTLSNAQYSTQISGPSQIPAGQVPQPTSRPATSSYAPQQQSLPALPSGGSVAPSDQQYPQPGSSGANRYIPRKHVAKKVVQPEPAPQPVPAATQPMSYPVPGQPLENTDYPQVGQPYPLGTPPSDYELQQRNLPPLRGYFDPRVEERAPLTPRQQAELALATIDGTYSGWAGASAVGHYRSGRAGVDRLAALEIPVEVSLVAGREVRLSIIPRAVFLTNGQLDTAGGTQGVTPIVGSLDGTAIFNPAQQFASGVGGEVQLVTNTFAVAVGTTPWEFLVSNIIGRGQWRPGNSHVLLFGGRDAVKETQLSYAGLRDPASATLTYSGNVWGGVVATGGGVRFDAGNERSGLYIQGDGAYLTGFHVLDNIKFDGTMGAYFRVGNWADYGTLNVGGLIYGSHFQHNERANTYGLGGYFSPEAYFLAAVPVTFSGHYGSNLHYTINSTIGVQTFAEDNGNYFPLDPALQTNAFTACVNQTGSIVPLINRNCGQQPVNSDTGFNYALDTAVSYRFSDHWFLNGFLSANNTNNYDSVTGGFSFRYMFRPQVASPEYPTGLFPIEGFRPLQVP